MIKVYMPQPDDLDRRLGGGFTFARNFKKSLEGKIEFVQSWQESDIVFVFGVTSIDKTEIHEAVKNGKKLVLRVDNIPRRSRNKRQFPAERLREFSKIASKVIYQSQWCMDFAGYFSGEGIIINNGVDTSIFNSYGREYREIKNRFLYVDFNPNPFKRFDEAIYWFERIWRIMNTATLTIVGNVPKDYLEHPEYNWDLNVPAKVDYQGICEDPKEMARIMRNHDYLIYPSFAEGYPNTVLEAIASGMEVIHVNEHGGAIEAVRNAHEHLKTIEEMAEEYYQVFLEVTGKQ